MSYELYPDLNKYNFRGGYKMKILVKASKELKSIALPNDTHSCDTGTCKSKCVVCRPYGPCGTIWED